MLDKNDLQAINNLLQPLRDNLDYMKTEMGSMKTEMGSMKADINDLKRTVSGIQLHLENTTDKNIRIIAENHLALSHKLDDVLKFKTERNLFEIRLNCVENDTREIKAFLANLHPTA